MIDIRLPEEVPGARLNKVPVRTAVRSPLSDNLEEIDFMRTRALRLAIHAREGSVCFYCLRRIAPEMQCLDHVIPRAQLGPNSYRNLISSCRECNSRSTFSPAMLHNFRFLVTPWFIARCGSSFFTCARIRTSL